MANKAIKVMKSASLLNTTVLCLSLSMLQKRNNGTNKIRESEAIKTIAFPKVERLGIFIQEAKPLPNKSPTLKRRNTDTGVKYFVAQSLPEFDVSDLMSTATDGKMVNVTLKVMNMLSRYTQLSFNMVSVDGLGDVDVVEDDTESSLS